MKGLAWLGVIALVLLFTGMSMALSLFADHASFVMEGVVPSARKTFTLRVLCGLFLSASFALFSYVWIKYRRIGPVEDKAD